jgi:hypothetical protein
MALWTSEFEIGANGKTSADWLIKGKVPEQELPQTDWKWVENASAISRGLFIRIPLISRCIKSVYFYLNCDTYFQNCLGWDFKCSSTDLSQRNLSVLMVVLTNLRQEENLS